MNHEDVKRRLLTDPEVRAAYENPPLSLIIARSVVEYRRLLGLTQEQFAELLGTSQNQIWRIESGDANLTVKTLEKLHEVVGMRFSIEPPESPTQFVSAKLCAQLGKHRA